MSINTFSSLISNRSKFIKPEIWDVKNLKKKSYLVITLHRPSNVDNLDILNSILLEIVNNCNNFPIIFPVHPRTLKNISKLNDILGEDKYDNENTKAVKDADGNVISEAVGNVELCVMQEFILRYFNVVGASPSKKIGLINRYGQLFKNFAVEILKKKPKLSVYGNNYNTADGTCIRDFIHVSDLADIHLKVLSKVSKNNKSIVLNCGYGKGFSVLEVVNSFKKFSKNKIVVQFEKRRKAEIVESVANVSKLKKYLQWRPKFFNLNRMIKNSIDWEKRLIK